MLDDLGARVQGALAGEFAIERELGGGGMARVFLARDAALDRQVVVKVLDLENAVAAGADRFQREIKVIARLQHPHIVPILTAGGADSFLWYAMPYVSGESLRARLVREGALPLADALRLAREVLDALSYAHAQGVVHRDIKPENILLEGRHAVVADFGVAKALADAGVSGALTTVGLALGTPAYMAPEQAMADATTNHRADLYATGVLLYEMLTGAPPFTGDARAVIAAHISAAIPRVEERRGDIPASVAQLIPRLMAKQPAERPQSAQEVVTVLEAVTTPSVATSPAGASDPTFEAAEPPPGRAPSGARRRALRRPAVLFTALGALAVAAGLWGWNRAQASPVVAGTEVIAIMPIGSTGDSALAQLGADLVVTLSASLDGLGVIRSVDPMTVLQAARALPQPLRLDDARALGARLRAASFVHGTVVKEGSEARIELALHPVAGGDPTARISVLGQPDSLRALTDTLMRRLLAQIWRKGAAPTSILTEATTASGEALRAFLAGENAFERSRMDSALIHYARAVELDSNFAQAWLRLDYSRGLVLLPVDTTVRRHLLALRDRLPQREKDWLALRFAAGPFLERLELMRTTAARYPESYPMLYLGMDMIVHSGPRFGIPISDAIPMLDRLASLAPKARDVDGHRGMVASAVGDYTAVLAGIDRARSATTGAERRTMDDSYRMFRSFMEGTLRDADYQTLAHRAAEAYPAGLQLNAQFGWYPNFIAGAFPLHDSAIFDQFLAAVDRTTLPAAYPQQTAYGRATFRIARGEVKQGITESERLAAIQGAPEPVRTTAAWAAANAAWFGLITPVEASEILARVRPSLQPLTPTGTRELLWAEGAITVAGADSAGLDRVIAGITDTSQVTGAVARGLRALWRERRTGEIDSLLAFEEEGIRANGRQMITYPVHRAAIGRALIRAGRPAEAERFLQWPDAVSNTVRAAQVAFQFAQYTAYERGLAAEAMGNRAAAVRHYSSFLSAIDRPPEVMRPAIEDAKARLGKLTGDAVQPR